MLNLALAFDKNSGRAENLDVIVSAIASRPKRIKRLPDGLIDNEYIERMADCFQTGETANGYQRGYRLAT